MQGSKVCILGAATLMGRALAFHLKVRSKFDIVALQDEHNTARRLCQDLGVIPTSCCVYPYCGPASVQQAISGSSIIVLAGGATSKCSSIQTDDELFKQNCSWVVDMAHAASSYNPEAHFVVLTQPINSMVPLVSYYFCPRKVYGHTSVCEMRYRRLLAAKYGPRKDDYDFLRVIGGRSQDSIVPMISTAVEKFNISTTDAENLVKSVKTADSCLALCEGHGNLPYWSLVSDAAHFLGQLQKINCTGDPQSLTAFTKCDASEVVQYFSTRHIIGPDGIVFSEKIPLTTHKLDYTGIQVAVQNIYLDHKRAKIYHSRIKQMHRN